MEITRTTEIINGKEIPVYRIPPGVSGISPEERIRIELEVESKLAYLEKKISKKKLDKILEKNDLDSEEFEDYMRDNLNPTEDFENIFDKEEEETEEEPDFSEEIEEDLDEED